MVVCAVKLTHLTSFFIGRTIRSIAVSRTTPFLFLGHTRAISVWDVKEGVCVSTFKAHTNGIRRLCVLEDESFTPSAPATAYNETIGQQDVRRIQLLSGAADGSVKLWRLPNVDGLKLWKPDVPDEQTAPPVSNGSAATSNHPQTTVQGQQDNGMTHCTASALSSPVRSGLKENLSQHTSISRYLSRRTPEASTDEEDSLFPDNGFTQVSSHRH